MRFLVDGAEISEHAGYDRIVYLFDGRDEGAVARARAAMEGRQGRRLRGDLLAAVARGPLGEKGMSRRPVTTLARRPRTAA